MKIGFIVSAYDRTDDLLAHTDILKFFPADHEVIPVWMHKQSPPEFVEAISKFPHAHQCDGVRFMIGPLLALLSGLRVAARLGLDYVLYRNGDDWMFNHARVMETAALMRREGKLAAGYSWLATGSPMELAMNELYLDVKEFAPRVDEADALFRKLSDTLPCEPKVMRWISKALGERRQEAFYRLPGREKWPGIGHFYVGGIPKALELTEQERTALLDGAGDNNRFFNREWMLIGSHDNAERYDYYRSLRDAITYADQLEMEPHFARWLEASRTGGQWNMPSEDRQRRLSRKRDFFTTRPRPIVRAGIVRPRTPVGKRRRDGS